MDFHCGGGVEVETVLNDLKEPRKKKKIGFRDAFENVQTLFSFLTKKYL